MKLKICPSGMYFWKNKWKKFAELDGLFMQLFGKTPEELGIKDLVLNPGVKKKCRVEKNGKKEVLEIEVTLSSKLAKQKSKYFEGVLQIRNSSQQIVDFIHSEISKQKQKGVFITKEIVEGKNADFFLTDQTYMKRLAVKLQKEFGGIISLNPKLFSKSRQTGKELYRLTTLLELPIIKKNDVIVVNDRLYRVNSVQQRINAEDFSGKKTSFPYKDHEVLEKQETRITKVYPSIEIIDPDSYQSAEVRNRTLKKKHSIDQKVRVVYWSGWWIVE